MFCWRKSKLELERFAMEVGDGGFVYVGLGGELEDGLSDISTWY